MDAATLQHNINILFYLKKINFRLEQFDEDYADRVFVWSEVYQPEECKHYQDMLDAMKSATKKDGHEQGIIDPRSKVCPRPVPKLKVPNDFAYRLKQPHSYISQLLAAITFGAQCTTIQRNIWHFLLLRPDSFAENLAWFRAKHEAALCAMTTLREEHGRPCENEMTKGGYFMFIEEVADGEFQRKYVRLCPSCKNASRESSDQKVHSRGHLYEFVNERLTRMKGSPLPAGMVDKLIMQDYLHYP